MKKKKPENFDYRWNYCEKKGINRNLDQDSKEIQDLFDGKLYRSMLRRSYFQNKDNILLWLAHYGFVFYAAKKENAWILIVIALKISTQERAKKQHMVSVMIIPEKPKDISSFLVPFVEELERLQDATYEAQRNFNFNLLLTSSDLMGASLLIGLKEGAGAFNLSSCRACHLLGYPTVTKKVASKYSTRCDHANHHEPSSKRPSKLSRPDHDILANPEPNDHDEPEYHWQKGTYYFPMAKPENYPSQFDTRVMDFPEL